MKSQIIFLSSLSVLVSSTLHLFSNQIPLLPLNSNNPSAGTKKCLIQSSFNSQEILKKNADEHIQKGQRGFFIENKGQWPEQVLYLARMGGLYAWITRNGVVYDFYQLKKIEIEKGTEEVNIPNNKLEHKKYERYGQVIRFTHVNGNAGVKAEGNGKQEGYYNYFIGNDPKKWASYVGLYEEVWVKDIYPGTNQRWYFDGGYLRYDYEVEPGADYRQIKIKIEGANRYEVKENGDLVLDTRFGKVSMQDLEVYEVAGCKKQKIEAKWMKENEWVRLEVKNHNPRLKLIIDPLIYSTFLGGTGGDDGNSLAVDASGNIYVTGGTLSTDFPVTVGCYDNLLNGGSDVFVTKLNVNGSGLVNSTFLGGNNDEAGIYLSLDASGNVYVTGLTRSTDLPVTPGCYDNSFNGGTYDVFVTKLNATGSALVYSTFLGGSDNEGIYSLALDATGHAYVTGSTYSTNFPATPGSYDNSHNGNWDVYVTKLKADGSNLVYSTFLGGSNHEEGYSLALDASGNVYVTGWTVSNDFPVSSGCYDNSHNGNWDVFVTKLNAGGTTLDYSTFLGGNSSEGGNSIALDASGNAYVIGTTQSINFPATPGCYDNSHNGSWDVFVTKLNTDGSNLVYSTFLGGSGFDEGKSLAVNTSGYAYVTGRTKSNNFPVTSGCYDNSSNGDWDVFISQLNTNGSDLMYSTYLGGSGIDEGRSITLDAVGHTCVTGGTASNNFPVTSGCYDDSLNGNYDAFVTIFCIPPTLSTQINHVSCYGYTNGSATVTVNGTGPFTYSWSPNISNGPTISNVGVGSYNCVVNGGCGSAQVSVTITQPPALTINMDVTPSPCDSANSQVQAVVNGGTAPYTYTWNTGATSNIITGISGFPPDTLIVTVYDTNGCMISDTTIVACTVTGLAYQEEEVKFEVMPNPSQGTIIILATKPISNVELLNVNGSVIKQLPCITLKSTFDLSELASGLYYLRASQKGGVVVQKVIIIH